MYVQLTSCVYWVPFTTEEITGCTNEAAKGANKAGKNLPYCFFYVLPGSVIPSINTFESSNDFMILIILPEMG